MESFALRLSAFLDAAITFGERDYKTMTKEAA
jgi:hypothetical protein